MTKKLIESEVSSNPESLNLAFRIRHFRDSQGKSNVELIKYTGMTNHRLSQTLSAQRYPTADEQNKLASFFNVSLETLRGSEVSNIIKQLEVCVDKRKFSEEDQLLLKKLENLVLTDIDRLHLHYYKSRLYRFKNDWEQATCEAHIGFKLAKKCLKPNEELFIRACNECCQLLFYTEKGQELLEFASQIQEEFNYTDNTLQLAQILHYKGLGAYLLKKWNEAKIHWEDASVYFQLNGKDADYARVISSIGTIHYLEGNISKALEQYEKAFMAKTDVAPYYRCVIAKEYARALCMAKNIDLALRIVDDTMFFITTNDLAYNEVIGKLLLVKGKCLNDYSILESVLDMENISLELQVEAHNCLVFHYTDRLNDDFNSNSKLHIEKVRFHHKASLDIIKRCKKYDNDFMRGEWF